MVILRFKSTTVFDISQTDGEPIETLAPEELTEAVADYDLFMKAITAVSPVPIRFDEIAGEMIDELSDNLQELLAEKKQLLESEQKQKLIPAMEAAGYHFDELESIDGNLRFFPDGTHEIGGVMISDSWNDVKEWLEGVVLENPDTAEVMST